MTAPEAKIQNRAPTVHFSGAVLRSTSHRPLPKHERDFEGQTDCRDAATLGVDRSGFEWLPINIGRKRESKATREVLDTIDTKILRAARIKGGARKQLEVNRDRIAELLGMHDNWMRPDEVYADEAWEICVIWRSEFGKVEIGTEEDGSIGYFVRRTLSESSREGYLRGCDDADKLRKIFSWLESDPEDI